MPTDQFRKGLRGLLELMDDSDALDEICRRHGCEVGTLRNRWIDEQLERAEGTRLSMQRALLLVFELLKDTNEMREAIAQAMFKKPEEPLVFEFPPLRLDEALSLAKDTGFDRATLEAVAAQEGKRP